MAEEENLVAKSKELMTSIPARILEFLNNNRIACAQDDNGVIKFDGNKTISFEEIRPETLLRPGIWLKLNDARRPVESLEQLENVLKMDQTRAFLGLPKFTPTLADEPLGPPAPGTAGHSF